MSEFLYPGIDKPLVHPDDWPLTNWTLGDNDLSVLLGVILSRGIQTILEFGSGLSSILLSQVCRVDTLENWAEHAERVRKSAVPGSRLTVYDYDGATLPAGLLDHYDLAIVDGPEPLPNHKLTTNPSSARENSFKSADKLADSVFAHDASWHNIALYQIQYLAPARNLLMSIKSDTTPEINRFSTIWVKNRGTK